MVTRDDYDADESLPYLIVRLGHQLSGAFDELIATAGITARQFGILEAVSKSDGIGSAELGRRFGITAQSAGQQVENMRTRGLLKRDRPGAGRKAGIHLTEKGRKKLATAVELAAAYETHLTEHLGPGGRKKYREALEEMERRI